MSKTHKFIRILVAVLMAVTALVILGLSLFTGPSMKDPRGVADDLGRRVEVRICASATCGLILQAVLVRRLRILLIH